MRVWPVLFLFACGPDTNAVVGQDGWLGGPWPSDAHDPPLEDFPEITDAPLGPIISGWAWRATVASEGFGANAPVYFPFDGPVDVPETLDGDPKDPVVLLDLDTLEAVPIMTRFVEDPLDDPFFVPNTLAILPQPGFAPRSGATMAAVVMKQAGVKPLDVDKPIADALKDAGFKGKPAIATTFTVQDTTGQLRSLAADLDERLDIRGWADPRFKQVSSLAYGPGTTPGGRNCTVQTVTFVDGSTDLAYLEGDNEPFEIDLLDWPVAVYQGELEILNHSGLEGRPFMSPGVAHLSDTDLEAGWIDFDGTTLLTEPVPERIRVVLQVPPGATDSPVLVWDHGTGGTAYNAVHRRRPEHDQRVHAQVFADANVVVLSRDQTLWGTRFPLLDEGFTDGWLGFYNVVNLTAMRDNHRQAGLEGHQLRHFVGDGLANFMPEGSIDPARALHLGHSLGAATLHNATAADPDAWEGAFASGSSSVFALSFLETALSGTQGDLVQTLGDLFGVTVGPDSDIGPLLAAGLGIEDPDAQAGFDRFHPAVGVFQWIMDPADPASFAADEMVPMVVLMGIDDWQIPNEGSRALANQLPDGTLVECEVSGYDPHHCLYGDPVGIETLSDWLMER